MLKNMNRVAEINNCDASMIFFDVERVGQREYQVHWVVPGRTPEDVLTGTIGKVFRNSMVASVWARREAECYASDSGGRVNGYAPNFDIWSPQYDG